MHISIAAEKLSTVFGLPITNSLIMSWVAMVTLIAVTFALRRTMTLVPGRFQAFIEVVFESLLNLVDSITQDRHKTEKFLPLVLTFFLFIITANWLSLLPGVGSIGIWEEDTLIPIFRPANTDLNNTLALAIIAVVAAHFFGLRSLGIKKHIGKFINVHGPIDFFVGLLEAIGEVSRVLSFSFRLFGNMFAGEVLLLVLASLIPVFIPIPFLGFELFVGFIQALVFAMLTLVFLTIATSEHH